MQFLDHVNDPADLKKLTVQELKSYSDELREFLLKAMSENGGHVAANLGVVELTVALHYVFKTPEDKIVWDVGHQCYAHKVITGRKDRFKTIRQDGGLSGFTKISESKYDVFGAGHSSTSISAGLGIAEGEWQAKSGNQVVSVIGDGALTAGMAYEGLNHAGHLRRPNFIVVFNDNEMSISENVGAVAKFLGQPSFFETLGFRYIGPIDGHNVDKLVEIFAQVKKLSQESKEGDAPILVHIKTKKGLGLKTAEKRPGDFHGVTGFSRQTGEPLKKSGHVPTYTGIFSQTLCKLAETDPTIVGVTAAMPEGTGLGKFQKLYPTRFYDVGIAEQHAVTFAGAMRLTGLKPAVAIYSTFLQRAYDQLIHDIGIQKIPLALFLDRGGLVGADGPTHHGVFDMSFLRCIPGFHIMAPKDENELQHMIYTALYCNQLAAVRFPRGEGYGVALDPKPQMLPLGKSEKLLMALYPTVSIWAAGSCVYPAVEAGKELQAMGIGCEVVNARFIKPLDRDALLKDANRVKLIVSVEENSVIGGLGSAILETLAENNHLIPTLNLGVPDAFIEHGNQGKLRAYCNINQKGIVAKTLRRLEKLKEKKMESFDRLKDPTFVTH